MASLWDNIVNHGLWGGTVETVKDAAGVGELQNPAKFTVIDKNGDKTEVSNSAAGPIYKTPTGYSASRSFAYLTQGADGKLTFTYSKSLADSDTFKKNYLENDTFKEIVKGYNANANAATPITTTNADGTTETVPYSQLIEKYNTALGEFATSYEGYSGIRDTVKDNTGFNLTDDEIRIVANTIDPKEKNSETKVIFLPDEWTQIHDFSKLDSWDADTKTVSSKDFFSEFNLDKEGGISEEEWNEMMGAANGVVANAYSGNMKRNVEEDADGDEEVEAKARDRLARSMAAANLLGTYDPEQSFWHAANIVGSNAVLEFTNFFAQAANNVATLEATAFDYINYGVELGAAYVDENVFNGALFGAASEDIASGAVNGNINEYINGILISSTDGSLSEVERVKAEFKAKVSANETLATFATTDENKLVAFDEAVKWHESYTAQIAPKAALAGQITGQLVALAVEVAIANGVGKAAQTAVGAKAATEALATGFAKGTSIGTRLKTLATFALRNKFTAFSANMLTQAMVDTLAFEKNSDFVAAFERLDKGEQDALTNAFMDNLVGNTVAELVGIGSSSVGGKIAASENPAIRFVNARVTKAVNTLSLPKKKLQIKFAESKIAQFFNRPLGAAGKASRQATDMAIKAINEGESTLFKAQTLEEWNIEKAKIEYEATKNIARAKKGIEYITDFEKNTTKVSETTTEAILGKASEKTNFLNQASRVVEGVKAYANEVKMNPAISTAMKDVSRSVNDLQRATKWSDFNPTIGKNMSQESANYVAHKTHYDNLIRKQELYAAEGLKLSAGDTTKLADLENWLNAFNVSHSRAVISALDNVVEKQRVFNKALTDWQVAHGVMNKRTYDSLVKTKIFGENDELYVRTIALPKGRELYDMSDEEVANIFKESDDKLKRFNTGTRDVNTIYKQDLHLGHGVDRNYLDPLQVDSMTIDSVAKAYQGKMWYNSLTSIKAPIRTLDTDGKPLKNSELKAATEHAKNAATESLSKISSDDLDTLGSEYESLTEAYNASRTEDVRTHLDKKTGKNVTVRKNRVESAKEKVKASEERVNNALGIKDDAQVAKNVSTLTPAQVDDIISQFGAEAPQYGKARSKAQLKAQYESLSEAQKKQALNAMGKTPIEQTKTVDGKIKNENYEAELEAWNNEKAAYESDLKAWKEEKAAYDKQKKAYDSYVKKSQSQASAQAKAADDSKVYDALFDDLNDASISQLKLDVKDATELDAEDAMKAVAKGRADELEFALREDLNYKEFLNDVREFANKADTMKANSKEFKEAKKALVEKYIDPEYLSKARGVSSAVASSANKAATNSFEHFDLEEIPIDFRDALDTTPYETTHFNADGTSEKLKSKKEYYNREKAMEVKVISMKPEEYAKTIVDNNDGRHYSSIEAVKYRTSKEGIDMYKKKFENGGREEVPYIKFNENGKFAGEQEGFHRSFAAGEVGDEEIPVLIVMDSREGRQPVLKYGKDVTKEAEDYLAAKKLGTGSATSVEDPGEFNKAKPTFDKKKPTKTIEGKKQQITRKAFDVDEPGAVRAWNQAVSETMMVDDLNKTYIRERIAPEEGSDIKKMSKKTRNSVEEYIANNSLRSWTPEGMAESGVEDFSTKQQKLDAAKERYGNAVKGLKEAKKSLKDAKAMAKRVLEGTDPFSNAIDNIVEMSVNTGASHLKNTSYDKVLETMAKEAGADVDSVRKHYTLSGMIKIDSDGSVKLNNEYKKTFRELYEKRVMRSLRAEVGEVRLSVKDAHKMIDEAVDKLETRVAEEWRQSVKSLSDYPNLVDTEKTFAAIEGEMKNIIDDVTTNRNVVQILDKDGEFKFVEVDPLIADLYRSRPYMLQGNDSLMRKLNKLARLSNTTFNPRSWVNQSFKDPIQSVIMAGWAHSIKTYQRELADMFGDQLVKYLQESMTEAGWEEFSRGLSESEVKLKAAQEMTEGVQGSGAFAGDLTQNKFYADQITGDDWVSKVQAAGIQGKAQMGDPYSKKKAIAAQKRAKQGFIDNVAEKSPGGKFNDKREIYFRKANYTAAFNDALKRGQTVEQARATAELVSRNATTNFSNTFMWGNWICNNVPFLSAAINGSASFWRLFEMDPVGISTRIAGAGLAMIAQVISSGQTLEDRKTMANISDSVKRGNIVIVRNGEAFKIPLPEEVSSFLAPFRQAAEKMLGSEDRSWVELLYNDALDISPIDLDGFSTEDQTALTKNEGLMSRLSRQTQVMVSQLTPPFVQTAIMGVTGKDPYTGNSIDNSYTWYDDEGNKQTYTYTQSEFAKWFASVANKLGWNVSADMSEALLEKFFGTGIMTFAESITDLGESMTGNTPMFSKAIEEPIKLGTSAMTVYDNQMQDQYDKDWRNMIKQLEREKNELLSSDGDYVDAVSALSKLKATDDNYETKKKNLTREALQPIEDYRKKVLDTVTAYVNHYGSDYDGSKFASVVSLLNFYTPTTIPTTALDFQREHENYYDSRDDAYQTMIDMGFSSPSTFSILGEAKRNKATGEVYTRFYSPTAILNAGNAVWSSAGKAINAEIAAALDVADIDRGEMFKGYYAAKAQGSNAAKQYKKDWNAKVVRAIYPVVKQYGPNIVLSNSTVKDYLEDYIFVSNPYKSEEYFKEIFGVEDQ